MIYFVYKYNKKTNSLKLIAEWDNISPQTLMKKTEDILKTLCTNERLYITMWNQKENKMLRLIIK